MVVSDNIGFNMSEFLLSETVRMKTGEFCFAQRMRTVRWLRAAQPPQPRLKLELVSFKFPIENRAPNISSCTQLLLFFSQGLIDSTMIFKFTPRAFHQFHVTVRVEG